MDDESAQTVVPHGGISSGTNDLMAAPGNRGGLFLTSTRISLETVIHPATILEMIIGRNDPCHCRSGKKYKKCCLAADESRAADERAATPSAGDAGGLRNFRDAVLLFDQMAERASGAKTPELRKLLEQAQLLRTFAERGEEVECARQTLEAHRGEFEKFMEDEEVYLERARMVFSDERFSTAWFNQEEVDRALKHAGYSPSTSDDESTTESLRAAILHLADKDTRSRLSMLLLNCLPEYVAAGQIIDGWIVEHCAYLLLDHPDDSNVFLFEMFSRGYDAWAAEKRAHEDGFLKEFGMDMERLTTMSMDEIDAWVAQHTSPEAHARIEAILKAHPGTEAVGVARLQNMERDSVTILDREDALPLMLSMEEMSPWLPRLQECLLGALQQLPEGASTAPDAQSTKALAEALFPVIREMTAGIFSPERIAKLAAQLKAYRNERFEAGDKRVAGLAQSAIMLINRVREPGGNFFLNKLCFFSIRFTTAA